MSDTPIPDKVFTYAFSDIARRGRQSRKVQLGHVYFMFKGSLSDPEKSMLLQAPFFTEFFPKHRFGIDTESGYAITDDLTVLSPGFTGEEDQAVQMIAFEAPSMIYPKRIVDACTLPHKTILGCSECLESKDVTEFGCQIKKMYDQECKNVPPETLQTLTSWKHLKKNIGEYTFISPVYATNRTRRTFSSRQQSHLNIDFGSVQDNVNARKEIAQNRKDTITFQNSECPECLVSMVCPKDKAKWCKGSYGKSEEQYYADILQGKKLKYTDAQISYLLLNSGELDFKIKRRRHYLTFDMTINGLDFVLGDLLTGHTESLTFKEAKELIEKYKYDSISTRGPIKITKKLKALLHVATGIRWSPTYNSGWHVTKYPKRFVTYYHGYRQLFSVNFLQSSRGKILPWPFEFDSLKKYYQVYERMPNRVLPERSPLR